MRTGALEDRPVLREELLHRRVPRVAMDEIGRGHVDCTDDPVVADVDDVDAAGRLLEPAEERALARERIREDRPVDAAVEARQQDVPAPIREQAIERREHAVEQRADRLAAEEAALLAQAPAEGAEERLPELPGGGLPPGPPPRPRPLPPPRSRAAPATTPAHCPAPRAALSRACARGRSSPLGQTALRRTRPRRLAPARAPPRSGSRRPGAPASRRRRSTPRRRGASGTAGDCSPVAVEIARARDAELRGDLLFEQRRSILRNIAAADAARELGSPLPREPLRPPRVELPLRDPERVDRDERAEAKPLVRERRQNLLLEKL